MLRVGTRRRKRRRRRRRRRRRKFQLLSGGRPLKSLHCSKSKGLPIPIYLYSWYSYGFLNSLTTLSDCSDSDFWPPFGIAHRNVSFHRPSSRFRTVVQCPYICCVETIEVNWRYDRHCKIPVPIVKFCNAKKSPTYTWHCWRTEVG